MRSGNVCVIVQAKAKVTLKLKVTITGKANDKINGSVLALFVCLCDFLLVY